MKLLILGASGKCGQWATRLAAQRGYQVAALVRETARLDAPPQGKVIRGDVLDAAALDRALDERPDAVLCCIGIRRAAPWNPWSRLISPSDLCQRVASLLVEALPRHGVLRLVSISAAGVGDSASRMSAINAWLFAHSNVGVSYLDLDAMERILRQSSLDWMAIRPATLGNGPPTGGARVIQYYGASTRIRRSDVAVWMLDALQQPAPFVDRTPMIGY